MLGIVLIVAIIVLVTAIGFVVAEFMDYSAARQGPAVNERVRTLIT
jgi:hypothetical protein